MITKQRILEILDDLRDKVNAAYPENIRVLHEDNIHTHRHIVSEYGKDLQLVDGAMVNVGDGTHMGEAWNINIIIYDEGNNANGQ